MTELSVEAQVADILAAVRKDGDAALARFCKEFDGVDSPVLAVSKSQLQEAWDATASELRDAFQAMAAQIRAVHEAQLLATPNVVVGGMEVAELIRPIRRVGLYVPGGLFAYPSTVLMTAVSASAAGVDEVVLCTPPSRDGSIPVATLAAAFCAGVTEVYAVGGAQAIGAMAYGTETIQPVDLIVGPGNRYVNEAKRQVFGFVGVDALAGPSEVAIIVDGNAVDIEQVRMAAAAQLEHGPDTRAFVFAVGTDWSAESFADVACEFETSGTVEEAVAKVNRIAPEHLEIYSARPQPILDGVRTAGAAFINTSAVVGDYIAGTNHVLPTGGSGRFMNGLRLDTFQRRIPVVAVVNSGVLRSGVVVAKAEGLSAHAQLLERLEGQQ